MKPEAEHLRPEWAEFSLDRLDVELDIAMGRHAELGRRVEEIQIGSVQGIPAREVPAQPPERLASRCKTAFRCGWLLYPQRLLHHVPQVRLIFIARLHCGNCYQIRPQRC